MMLVIVLMSLLAISFLFAACYYHDKYYDTLHELGKLKQHEGGGVAT